MSDTSSGPNTSALLQAALANPPSAAVTTGSSIPETDPTYLSFAAGQGFRAAEATAYTALKQNAIHQAYQDQLPAMILSAQNQALSTNKTYGEAGDYRSGARLQQQGRDTAQFENQVTTANNSQQAQQNDLQAQLAAHIADLQMDTSSAALEARNNNALNTAAQGSQAYVAPSQTSAQEASAANPSNPGGVGTS